MRQTESIIFPQHVYPLLFNIKLSGHISFIDYLLALIKEEEKEEREHQKITKKNQTSTDLLALAWFFNPFGTVTHFHIHSVCYFCLSVVDFLQPGTFMRGLK